MATSEFVTKLGKSTRPSAQVQGGSLKRSVLSRLALTSALMMISDVFAVLLALVLALRIGLHRPLSSLSHPDAVSFSGVSFSTEIGYLAGFIFALLMVSHHYGLYGPLQLKGALYEQRTTVQASLIAGLLLCGALYLTHGTVISRTVVLIMVAITSVILCARRAAWRYVTYRNYELGLETRNLIVIGSSRISDSLRKHIVAKRNLGFKFRGFVTLPGSPLPAQVPEKDILGGVGQLRHLVRQHFIDELLIAEPCTVEQVIEIVEQARELEVDVHILPGFHEAVTVNSTIEYLGDFPVVSMHRRDSPVVGLAIKRLVDIAVSVIVLAIASPLMLGVAIAVAVSSPGPVFYTAERVGKKGRIFRCYKFRTMYRDAEKRKAELMSQNERSGILFKMKNDPRITPVGRILRKYSLDELPQLFNVLHGEMSLVGPRPPIASEVERYEIEHFRRLAVTPGLTGLWQVQARRDPSFERYIALDTAYVENWSFWLDLKLLVLTAGVVLRGTGS